MSDNDLDWTEDGAPRSRRYDDVYFSRQDGLAESRAVFLQGCGLPEGWRGRSRFTVAELGFGTGLNILALLQLWAASRPAGGRLSLMSVEAHPLAAADAARALAAWPELAELAGPLLERWPRAPGVTRVDWPALGATLDVIVNEAEPALTGWDGAAEAWFLDGFSPARNPEIWRPEVLSRVAARSAAGARLATFTVAGAVRRELEAQGFLVERRPGYGAKRQRLEGRLERPPARLRTWTGRPAASAGSVAVIGAGVAGAAAARALLREGRAVTVVAPAAPGASGNPAALVTPRLERGVTPSSRLSAQAFRRAAAIYAAEAPEAVLRRGVRRLGEPQVLAAIGASPLYAAGELALEPPPLGGLLVREALVIEPRLLLAAWLAGADRVTAEVVRLERRDGTWRLLDGAGVIVVEAEAVVLAGGYGSRRLRRDLPLGAVRGQLSWAPGLDGPAATWGGYCAPTRDGLMFGATHDRGDEEVDVRPADHARNLAALAEALPALAGAVDPSGLAGRAGLRATLPDHLPMAGPAVDSERFRSANSGLRPGDAESDPCHATGLWVLAGLGARGFTTAPLLGEHIAAQILGSPSPLPLDLATVVHPARFIARALIRAPRSRSRPGALSSATKQPQATP
jgi:tRNA 5-methylaminomethyl-2-thiouridine biosynthesis bifunctional protein